MSSKKKKKGNIIYVKWLIILTNCTQNYGKSSFYLPFFFDELVSIY